jgi:hypothetical protein
LELFSLGEEKYLEASLNICVTLFLYVGDQLGTKSAEIMSLIQRAMETNNTKLQMISIQALGSLITTLSSKDVKAFFKFCVPLMKIVHGMFFGKNCNVDHGSETLVVIAEICETDPKFFRANFNDLIDLLFSIRNMKDIELGIKDQALEITVSISQRYPEFLQKNKALLSKVIEMVFLHMLEIPDECPQEWANPPDGFDDKKQEDEGQKIVKFSTDCIDRLCANVGSELMLKNLGDCVGQLLKTGEWKKVFASFMALSQVGEYMENIEELKPILELLKANANHAEPRVRHAVCHCLGQISDDFAPKFQDEYHTVVIPLLMARLDDPVPRVMGHACASLTNFLENCKDAYLVGCFDQLYTKVTQIIDKASSYVKENALGTLSAMSVGAPDLFIKYFDPTMEVLLKILVEINQEVYKRLRGNSIECISIITQQVGKDRFLPYADRLIAAMINIQTHHLKSDSDPQTNFILLAWPRISSVLKEDFNKYIPNVVPSLLQICVDIVKKGNLEEPQPVTPQADENSEDEKADQIHTYLEDECLNALASIQNIMEDCSPAMAPYIETVYNVVVPLLDYLSNEEIRMSASEALPLMIKCLKTNENFAGLIPKIAKDLITKLWNAMDEETEPEMLIKQATSMQELIEASGSILDPSELDLMFNKCVEHLQRSDERKKHADTLIDEDEDEAEVVEVHEQDKDLENQLHCTIAEIFGKIFMTHKEKSLKIFDMLHNMFIQTSLKDDQNDMIKKFGLFLICDSVDHLGTLVGEAKLEQYYQQLKKYALYPSVFVRHAAVYGLGSMATILSDKFAPIVKDCLQTLRNSLTIGQGAEEEKIYKATRDNTASSIGKVIKATWTLHSETELKALLTEWLNLLPLRKDKIEAVIQHQMMADILEKQKEVLFHDIHNFEKTLKVIAATWRTKCSNKDLDLRYEALIRQWTSDPVMIEAMKKVNLEDKQKEWLQKIVVAATSQ